MALAPTTPDLISLDLFCDTVANGSISHAARLAGISQPAASERLTLLERALGMALLERGPNGSTPTTQGRLVAEWAGEVVAAMRRLTASTEALRAQGGTRLAVAASFTVAEYMMPRLFARWRAAHPGVRVQLDVRNSAAVEQLVRDGVVAVGFIESPCVADDLESMVFDHDELVVIVSVGHPWADATTPLGPAELGAAAWISREEGSGTRDAFVAAMRRAATDGDTSARGDVDFAVELGSTVAVKQAVIDGAGPAVLSRLVVAAELDDGRLVAVPVAGIDLQRSLRVVWTGSVTPSGLVGDLIGLTGAVRTGA